MWISLKGFRHRPPSSICRESDNFECALFVRFQAVRFLKIVLSRSTSAEGPLQHNVWLALPSTHDALSHSDPVVLFWNTCVAGMYAMKARNKRSQFHMFQLVLHQNYRSRTP
jgi:hypothetical protein